MLVDGFDEAPALMMPWNPPYYPALLESWHMRKEQDLFAYLIERDKLHVEDWLRDEIRHLKEQKALHLPRLLQGHPGRGHPHHAGPLPHLVGRKLGLRAPFRR